MTEQGSRQAGYMTKVGTCLREFSPRAAASTHRRPGPQRRLRRAAGAARSDLLGLVLASIGAIAWFLSATTPPPARAAADEAPGPPLSRTVAALGTLEPEGRVLRITSSTEDRVAEVMAAVGNVVEAGTVLVRLESHAELLAQRNLIESRLTEARALLAATTALQEAAVREAELGLDRIETLARLEIESLQANVRRAEAARELETRELDRLTKLRTRQAAAQSQLDRQQLQAHVAREDLVARRSDLALRKARQAADQTAARAALETARRNLSAEQSQISIASIERELALAGARIERTLVRAPTRGRVLRLLALPGEAASPGVAIIEFADTSRMTVLAEVYESDIKRVSVGDRVEVSSPALESKITGKVDLIGSVVRQNKVVNLDPAADADTRVVEIRAQVDQDEQASRFLHLHVDVLIFAGAGSQGSR